MDQGKSSKFEPNRPMDWNALKLRPQTSDGLLIDHAFLDSSGAPTAQQSNIRVSLHVRPNNQLFAMVELLSNVRKRANLMLWSRRPVEMHARPEAEILKEIGITGAALAEYQYGQFGDNHDHLVCENLAKEAFKELMSDLAQKGAK